MPNYQVSLSQTTDINQRYAGHTKLIFDQFGYLHAVYNGYGTLHYLKVDIKSGQKIYDYNVATGLLQFVFASIALDYQATSPETQKIALLATKQTNPDQTYVYLSSNGGASFSYSRTITNSYNWTSLHPWIDSNYLYAITSQSGPGTFTLYRFDLNSGASSTLYTFSCPSFYGGGVCFNGQLGYLAFGFYNGGNPATGYILKSVNGGSSWQVLYYSNSLNSSSHYASIRVNWGANNGNDVIVAQFGTDLLVSLNGGQTFTRNANFFSSGDSANFVLKYPRIYFATPENGYDCIYIYLINSDGTLNFERKVTSTFSRTSSFSMSEDFYYSSLQPVYIATMFFLSSEPQPQKTVNFIQVNEPPSSGLNILVNTSSKYKNVLATSKSLVKTQPNIIRSKTALPSQVNLTLLSDISEKQLGGRVGHTSINFTLPFLVKNKTSFIGSKQIFKDVISSVRQKLTVQPTVNVGMQLLVLALEKSKNILASSVQVFKETLPLIRQKSTGASSVIFSNVVSPIFKRKLENSTSFNLTKIVYSKLKHKTLLSIFKSIQLNLEPSIRQKSVLSLKTELSKIVQTIKSKFAFNPILTGVNEFIAWTSAKSKGLVSPLIQLSKVAAPISKSKSTSKPIFRYLIHLSSFLRSRSLRSLVSKIVGLKRVAVTKTFTEKPFLSKAYTEEVL